MQNQEWMEDYQGYIDMHCHIIPHVDDGARTSAQALSMIELAYQNGIRTMIATPHHEVGRFDENRELIDKYFLKLLGLVEKKYPDFHLYLGNEIFYSYGVADKLLNGEVYTMAGSHYVLIEFSPDDTFDYIEKSLYEIVNIGYIPILAHVERYDNVIRSSKNVERLVEAGIYIQTNASTVAGSRGWLMQRKVLKLIKNDLIHFISTDAHGDKKRTPSLAECLEVLRKKTDEDTINLLLRENALQILRDEEI